MEFERKILDQKPVRNHSLYLVVLASVGLHIALGMLVLTLNKGTKIKSNKKEMTTIQANLVYVNTLPKAPVSSAPIDHQSDTESMQDTSEAKPASSQNPVLEVNQNAEPASALEKRRKTLPAIKYDVKEVVSTSKDNSGLPVLSSRELAQQHLRVYSEQANQRLAQDQSKQYQQAKISPDLQLPTINPFLTEDEKYLQKRTVKVNCSSSLNKAIANLSGTLGWNVRCTEMPAIGQFIDNRINKASLLKDQ